MTAGHIIADGRRPTRGRKPFRQNCVLYEWDFGDGSTATGAVVHKSFSGLGTRLVTLCVTDSFGLKNCTQSQFVAVSVAFATHYEICWSVRESRFIERKGLKATFTNNGGSEIEDLMVTLTSVPSNLTIVSATALLGDLDAGESRPTACDSGAKTADIVVRVNSRVAPSGDYGWKAEFESNGLHYIIPNLPPLAP